MIGHTAPPHDGVEDVTTSTAVVLFNSQKCLDFSIIAVIFYVTLKSKVLPEPHGPRGGADLRFCSPQLTRTDHGYGASASRGVSVYVCVWHGGSFGRSSGSAISIGHGFEYWPGIAA